MSQPTASAPRPQAPSSASPPPEGPSPQQLQRLRQRMRAMAHWLDELVAIPGTKMSIGLDAVIGFVPVVGDLLGFALGLWMVGEARAGGAPPKLQGRMLRNLGLETLVGFVPLLGDLFDVAFRANSRNRALVEDWLDAQERVLQPPRPRRSLAWRLAATVLLLLVAWAIWRYASGSA